MSVWYAILNALGPVSYTHLDVYKRQFQMFVDPHRPLQLKIIDLTGITDQMLAGQPDISEAIPQFLDYVGGRPLCAHNADFDIGFVTAACERLGLSLIHI